MMHQRVVGVDREHELPALPALPRGTEHRLEIFGCGGGERVAATLSQRFGYDVPVLGRIPLDLVAARGRRRRQADRRGRPDRPGGRGADRRSPSGWPAAAAAWPACSSGSTPDRQVLGLRRPAVFGGRASRELVVIAFVAVLVFGPDKLPELARQAGRMVRKAPQLRQHRARRAAQRARPGVRRPRAARPRPAHHRPQAHHRGDGGRRARSRAGRSASGAAPARGRRGRRRTTWRPPDASCVSLAALHRRATSGCEGATRHTRCAARRCDLHEVARRPGAGRRRGEGRRAGGAAHRSPASAIRRRAEPRPSRVTGDQATSGTERSERPVHGGDGVDADHPVLAGAAQQAPAGRRPARRRRRRRRRRVTLEA